MNATRLLSCIIFCGAIIITPEISDVKAEEYLTDDSVSIVRHDRRRTSIEFKRRADRPISYRWGRIYRPHFDAEDDEKILVSYKELPPCRNSKIYLQEVYQHNRLTDGFDVVFYSKESSQQRANAMKSSRRAVAYESAFLRDRKTGDTDLWQTLARLTEIQCLPTRFHFTFIGSRRYMEYRTGSLAWSE